MANNSNDTGPMPAPKKNPGTASKPDLKLPPEDAELPETEPMTGLPLAVPPLPEGAEFDSAVPMADPASGIQSGTRHSAGATSEDPDAAVGNLEPVAPVAPASGWLDSDVPLPKVSPDSQFPEGDLEATPKVESSDIFSTGAVPPAPVIGGSDVIMATAFGPIPFEPEKPTRPSDVAITFDQPPGATTIRSGAGSGELPVADEVSDGSDPMFDSSRLGAVEPPSADSTDYGSTPEKTEDTSSILADLSDPGDITIDDSSAIRLEAPGVQRTLSSQPSSGTEFDLTVGEDDIPAELNAAADEAAASGLPSAWARKRSQDPTQEEIDMEEGQVNPIDMRLRSSDPSSIFDSINDPVVFRKPGETERSDDEDVAVEFSDHPDTDHESSSGLFGMSGPPSIRKSTPRPASEPDFELPARPISAEDSGALDLGAPPDRDQDAPSSSILMRGGTGNKTEKVDSETDMPTRAATPVTGKGKPKPPKSGPSKADIDQGAGSVELDWLSGSSEEQPILPGLTREPESRQKPSPTRKPAVREPEPDAKASPARPTAAAKKPQGSMLSGALIGAIIATSACAGVYFSGIINNSPKMTQGQPKGQPGVGTPDGNQQPAPVVGRTRLFAAIGAADEAELNKAREELQAIANEVGETPETQRKAAEATLSIGVSHEAAGDRSAARKVYEEAKKKFPAHATLFQTSLDRLSATEARTDGISRRLTPADAEQLLLAVVLLQDNQPAAEEPEAGVFFWKAVNSATAGKYAEAIEQIDKAKAAHVKQSKAIAGRGVNPLSDPLEQIFPRACDDLKTYWKLREAVYSNKAVADLIKKDGVSTAMAQLALAQTRAAAGVKAVADLKDANAKLTKASTDLKDANTKLTKTEKDLLDAKELVLQAAKAQKEAESAKTAAETARKSADEMLVSLAKELQTAKLLPEKYDSAALLAAQKSATERATGPALSALLPPGMMAVGGAGLSAGQLIDVSERLTKAEAISKAADGKLATESKKLKDEYAVEAKKLSERYATDAKKLMDSHDTKVKDLETVVAREKAEAESLAAKFKVDLGNAMSPAQALDVWLPLLTDLRRASDADQALATATKVISISPADSDDTGKARTVAGMAHFLKGDMEKAKEMFTIARSSPAYRAAPDKAWARAADTGLRSIDDPLAPYRQPVEVLKRDVKAAARHLDAGVKAYKAGRFADAVTALTDSTKADPTNPIAWYFLGAARWEMGVADKAKEDFQQGGEREKFSPFPTRAISDSLAPIQGAARDALTASRP